MLVIFHNDVGSPEAHPLHFEAQPLLKRQIEFKPDVPARSHNPLPRQFIAFLPQQLDHLTVIERISGSGRNLRVGCDLAFGDRPYDAAQRGVAIRVFRRANKAARDLVVHTYLPRRRKVTPATTVNGYPGVAWMRPIA